MFSNVKFGVYHLLVTVSSEHKKHKEVAHLLKSGGGKGGGRGEGD